MKMKYKATINLVVEVTPLTTEFYNCEKVITWCIEKTLNDELFKKKLPGEKFEITDVSSCLE